MSKHMREAPAAPARGNVPARRRRRGHGRAIMVLVVLLLVAGLALCGFLLVRSARIVQAEAAAAKKSALVVAETAFSGDATALTDAADDLTSSAQRIDRELSGVLWACASHLPVLGSDVTCARVAASVADDLCAGVLAPVVDEMAGTGLDDLVEGHTVNCGVLRRLDTCVTEAEPVVHEATLRLEALPRATTEEVREVVASIAEPVRAIDDALAGNDTLLSTLLAMLGDGGASRTYVLCALGNSELRASGGMPGSIGVVRVSDGAIELEDFTSVHRLQAAVREAGFTAPATQDELECLGTDFVSDAAFLTSTPDFPRAAENTSAMWEAGLGEHVDGVIAMDPVFLGRVLAVTGPVVAEDGTIVNGENCAAELLSDVYWRYGYETNSNELEDAFFSDVARKSFDALFDSLSKGGALTAMRLAKVVTDSGEDRRLQAWMEREDERQLVGRLGLSGTVAGEGHEDELGIYVNDISWNKLCWYLDIFYDLERAPDAADGRAVFDVAVHFTNAITEDEAAQAPAYISQMYQKLKRAPSDLVEEVLFMAPAGGAIEGFEVHPDAPIGADKTVPDERHTLYGRDTWRSRLNILGEGDTYVTFRLTMPAGATTPRVVTSPLCHD